MRDGRFRDVADQLLDAGVSPRRVRRLISELADHSDDLREELMAETALAPRHRYFRLLEPH